MANEMVRKGSGSLAKVGGSALKKAAKKTELKHAAKKYAEKHAAKKHAAKKHAKKAAKHVGPQGETGLTVSEVKGGKALRKAFHHLQRASGVISLVEKGNGGDLLELLHFGMELYRGAVDMGGKHKSDEAALGVLRAAEHLGMAGFYAARKDHLVGLEAPSSDKDEKRLKKVAERLEDVSDEQKGYWVRVRSMALELVRRAEAAGDDPHLQWELGIAAESLCDALEAVD
ncbi:MAG: hypothetical protein JWM43_615 [Acidobacteriaceae bacterium]|nr:hypothetical protein [Acidobacteriaceae bacterium]